jgi:hypothetical protein
MSIPSWICLECKKEFKTSMRARKLEQEVRDIIKRNRWLTLSTSSPKGKPQSSLVVYASDGNKIIILTGKKHRK